MSEVAATGMLYLYPGVCTEGMFYPHAHFLDTCDTYMRGQTLYSFTTMGFPTASINGRVEVEACVFCFVVNLK